MSNARGWFAAIGLALGAAAAVGLARFAYALVLPSMQHDLFWSYAQAGSLGTANALGYLAGTLLVARLTRVWGSKAMFILGLAATTAALVGSGSTHRYAGQLVWRAVAGVGAAGTFVCGGVLASAVDLTLRGRRQPGLAVTIFFAGGGLGILASGATIPTWIAQQGDHGWPVVWFSMAILSGLALVVGAWNMPRIVAPGAQTTRARWPVPRYRAALASYFLFGLGYIAYMTFVVAWMRAHGASPLAISATWAALGATSVIAPALWGTRFRLPTQGGAPMGRALIVTALGSALPLCSSAVPVFLLSASLVGSAVFMVPAAVNLLIRDEVDPEAWSTAMAGLTLAFAAGQAIGPLLTGYAADVTGSLLPGLAASTTVLAVASVVAFRQAPARINAARR